VDLEVTSRRESGATIVSAVGEVDVWTAERLRTVLHEVEEQTPQNLVVDLTDVGFLDSTGIGVLVGALRRQREAGRELQLVVSNSHVLKVLTITSLDKVFPITSTLTEALQQVGSAS
jgi:anti-sigma B factor antagonist